MNIRMHFKSCCIIVLRTMCCITIFYHSMFQCKKKYVGKLKKNSVNIVC